MTHEPELPLTGPLSVLLSFLPLARRTRIVDVGANPMLDAAPYAALLRMGACDVIGFEPQPQAFAALQKMQSDRERYFPFAVGDGSRKVLKVFRSAGYTSVYDAYQAGIPFLGRNNWSKVLERIEFDTVRLDDQPEVGVFDLLKIDIQGGECDVFRGAEHSLKQAMVVIVELRYFRLYEGEPMMGGVDEELRRQGFYLHKFLFNKSRATPNSQSHRLRDRRVRDQLVDGDGVYLRDMAQIESYADDQLIQLCITASTVFASHSLVLYCLDELVRRGVTAAEAPVRYVDELPAEFRIDILETAKATE
jgi:FkbM family methyltransferase